MTIEYLELPEMNGNGGCDDNVAVMLKRRRLASDDQRTQLAALVDEFVDLVTP